MVKGNVRRKYSEGTTLADVYEQLLAEFEMVKDKYGRITIEKMIDKCTESYV